MIKLAACLVQSARFAVPYCEPSTASRLEFSVPPTAAPRARVNTQGNSTPFFTSSDDLGLFARLSIDPQVFCETAVLKTAYWFTDSFYVFIARDRSSGVMSVELRLKQGDSTETLRAACGEFTNQLLDNEVRQRVLSETSAVRDTLIKKAFFEAKATPPVGLVSDESRVCGPDQTPERDPVGARRRT